MPTLSISIVTYQSNLKLLKTTLLSLIEELKKLARENQFSLEKLYVIDNDSGSDYRMQLAPLLRYVSRQLRTGRINYLPQEENRGFGAGHNIAIRDNTSDYLLVLNPDVTFFSDALKQGLVALQANKSVGLCVPLVYSSENIETPVHSLYPTPFDILLRSVAPGFLKKLFQKRLSYLYQLPIDSPIPRGAKAVFSGCCMLFEKNTLNQTGGFDERFFVYFEDYELSLRLLSHTDVLIASGFQITHKGGSSFSKNKKHIALFIQSALRFYL